jgi:polyvinyl alcohol dehydrogenase (cytochrome)
MGELLPGRIFLWLYLAAASLAAFFAVKMHSKEASSEPTRRALNRPFCAESAAFERPFGGPYWNGWGAGDSNARSQSAKMAGLPKEDVGRLKLKWAFGVPGVKSILSQPAVAGGRIFFGAPDGKVYSLDADSGCIHWTFDADANVRTAITIGEIGGRWAAYFGDYRAKGASVYAVDAATGKLIWKTLVDESVYSHITGAPVLAAGKLFVPLTANDDASAGKPTFECCRMRGSLVALDSGTGLQLWKSYTIPTEPHPTYKNSLGVQQWGPSGAGIWSAPTVDLAKRAVYVTTGDGHTAPSTPMSDAILAFDIDSGSLLWSRQMSPGDVWNAACVLGDAMNCPDPHGEDLDFGSSAILVDLRGGKRALIAGQKSGVVYAIDPDRRGKLIWEKRIGKGGFIGGIQWGPSVDEKNVYVALSDLSDVFPRDAAAADLFGIRKFSLRLKRRYLADDGGGTFALKLESGEQVWHTGAQCDGSTMCKPAQVAAITGIPGVVFSGTLDGYLRAYSTEDGAVIWKVGTAREFVSVNRIETNGGSFGGPGPVVVGGVVYVTSGYPAIRGMTGNALLAYSVDGR